MNFRARGVEGLISGQAVISFIQPPSVRVVALESPCPGKGPLEFEVLVESEDPAEQVVVNWLENQEHHRSKVMLPGRHRFSSSLEGVVELQTATSAKTGDSVEPVKGHSRVNLAYKPRTIVTIIDYRYLSVVLFSVALDEANLVQSTHLSRFIRWVFVGGGYWPKLSCESSAFFWK